MDFTVTIIDPCPTATLSFVDRDTDFPDYTYNLRDPDYTYKWTLITALQVDAPVTCEYAARVY